MNRQTGDLEARQSQARQFAEAIWLAHREETTRQGPNISHRVSIARLRSIQQDFDAKAG
jgi:hypothetical protein